MARRIQCAGAGHDTLIAYHSADEWAAYEQALAEGRSVRLPSHNRECLLCLRNRAGKGIGGNRAAQRTGC